MSMMIPLTILVLFCIFMMWASMRRELPEGQALIGAVFAGPLLAGAFIVGTVVIGSVLESYGQHREQLDRCKRQATTPHEYYQCR